MQILHEAEQSERRYIPRGPGVGHVPYSLDLAIQICIVLVVLCINIGYSALSGFPSNHNRRPLTHQSDQITKTYQHGLPRSAFSEGVSGE
jgi:hypothetical protein